MTRALYSWKFSTLDAEEWEGRELDARKMIEQWLDAKKPAAKGLKMKGPHMVWQRPYFVADSDEGQANLLIPRD